MLSSLLMLQLIDSAHAGCEKDTDCKGERICAPTGQCIDPPLSVPCTKDTDCPGQQLCGTAGVCEEPGGASSGVWLSSEERWSFPTETALAQYERMRVTTMVNRLTTTNTAAAGAVVGVGTVAVGGGTTARISEEGTRVRWVDGTGVTFNTDAAIFDRVGAHDWHLDYVDGLTTRARKDNLKRVWLPAGGAAIALSVTGLSLARAEYCSAWEWFGMGLDYSACETTIDEAVAAYRASVVDAADPDINCVSIPELCDEGEARLREEWSIVEEIARSDRRTYRYATLGAVAVTATVAAIVAAKRQKRYRSHQVPHAATLQLVDAYNRSLANELGATVEAGTIPEASAVAQEAYELVHDKRSQTERR